MSTTYDDDDVDIMYLVNMFEPAGRVVEATGGCFGGSFGVSFDDIPLATSAVEGRKRRARSMAGGPRKLKPTVVFATPAAVSQASPVTVMLPAPVQPHVSVMLPAPVQPHVSVMLPAPVQPHVSVMLPAPVQPHVSVMLPAPVQPHESYEWARQNVFDPPPGRKTYVNGPARQAIVWALVCLYNMVGMSVTTLQAVTMSIGDVTLPARKTVYRLLLRGQVPTYHNPLLGDFIGMPGTHDTTLSNVWTACARLVFRTMRDRGDGATPAVRELERIMCTVGLSHPVDAEQVHLVLDRVPTKLIGELFLQDHTFAANSETQMHAAMLFDYDANKCPFLPTYVARPEGTPFAVQGVGMMHRLASMREAAIKFLRAQIECTPTKPNKRVYAELQRLECMKVVDEDGNVMQ